MKIFKNRGDIYFSKFNKEQSAEQKFLLSSLAIIVVFSVIFLLIIGIKSDFSAKKFFKPDQLPTSPQAETEIQEELPRVSGKTNLLTAVSDKDNLLFLYILQVDMDAKAYKISALKADTKSDSVGFNEVFKKSGVANLKNSAEELLDTEIDYYISIDKKELEEIFDEMGSIDYPVLNDVKFSGETNGSSFSIKLNAGEQRLNARQTIGLVRYYLDIENNPSMANDIILSGFSQLLNSKNFGKREEIFKMLTAYADTDITVRDFSSAADTLTVMCSDASSMGVYNAAAEYDEAVIKEESIRKVRGYFVK